MSIVKKGLYKRGGRCSRNVVEFYCSRRYNFNPFQPSVAMYLDACVLRFMLFLAKAVQSTCTSDEWFPFETTTAPSVGIDVYFQGTLVSLYIVLFSMSSPAGSFFSRESRTTGSGKRPMKQHRAPLKKPCMLISLFALLGLTHLTFPKKVRLLP